MQFFTEHGLDCFTHTFLWTAAILVDDANHFKNEKFLHLISVCLRSIFSDYFLRFGSCVKPPWPAECVQTIMNKLPNMKLVLKLELSFSRFYSFPTTNLTHTTTSRDEPSREFIFSTMWFFPSFSFTPCHVVDFVSCHRSFWHFPPLSAPQLRGCIMIGLSSVICSTSSTFFSLDYDLDFDCCIFF